MGEVGRHGEPPPSEYVVGPAQTDTEYRCSASDRASETPNDPLPPGTTGLSRLRNNHILN